MKNEYELVDTKLDTKSWFDHQIIDHQEVHQYTKITHKALYESTIEYTFLNIDLDHYYFLLPHPVISVLSDSTRYLYRYHDY